jgi:hypothetical protein
MERPCAASARLRAVKMDLLGKREDERPTAWGRRITRSNLTEDRCRWMGAPRLRLGSERSPARARSPRISDPLRKTLLLIFSESQLRILRPPLEASFRYSRTLFRARQAAARVAGEPGGGAADQSTAEGRLREAAIGFKTVAALETRRSRWKTRQSPGANPVEPPHGRSKRRSR